LIKSKGRFLRHFDLILKSVEAAQTDLEKKRFHAVSLDKQLKDKDLVEFLENGVKTARRLTFDGSSPTDYRNKRNKLKSYIVWLYRTEPGLENELQVFVDDKQDFLKDSINKRSLEKYFQEFYDFLLNTKTLMESLKEYPPFNVKGSKLTLNSNEIKFKQIASESYAKLDAAHKWIQDRMNILLYDDWHTNEVALFYKNIRYKLHGISYDVYYAKNYLVICIENLYNNLAAYKTAKKEEKKEILNGLKNGLDMEMKDSISMTEKAITIVKGFILQDSL